MKLEEFNKLKVEEAKKELLKCCGSSKWVNELIKSFPFKNSEELINNSDDSWKKCSKEDWLEAFSHHPKIGERVEHKKFESTKMWAEHEQSGTRNAEERVLDDLLLSNIDYEKKYGHIFIVCATGKSASEMLSILKHRMKNEPGKEIQIAAEEQNKITHLRLEKLLS
jgi:2-oxo-4-hydroxy-4-carboxy-5-ureidoimidazoline decarboxylase